MKCTSCGLPLSPARTMTSCPRCGTPIVSEKRSSSSPKQRPFLSPEAWQPLAEEAQLPEMVRSPMRRPGEAHAENDRIPTGNVPGASFPFADAQGLKAQPIGKVVSEHFQPGGAHVHASVSSPPAVPAQSPIGQPAPAERGGDGSNVQQLDGQGNGGARLGRVWTDEQMKGFGQGADPALLQQAALSQELAPAASGQRPWPPTPTRALRDAPLRRPPQSKNNLGFLVAGLCVITGGLILFFVYFMALGAPGNSNSNSTGKTTIAPNSSPMRTPSPASSPTATPFPGQKYIDHAQLASRIDPTSHQPIVLTTIFKANQDIYVTFQLHPAGQNGAVCLLWYANNKMFIPSYALQVYPNAQTGYTYATYIGTGSGYVELYWASTTRCTDKVLAQRVYFTVTA